ERREVPEHRAHLHVGLLRHHGAEERLRLLAGLRHLRHLRSRRRAHESPPSMRSSSRTSSGMTGIRSTGTPSASDNALAIAADTGIVPASPTPLMPRGLFGEGVSVRT